MRVLIFTFLLSKTIFAQYDSTMYDLIKTTYEKSFDKEIIFQYLNSNDSIKIHAAVLSIAQSEDTSFVPVLLELDLSKYGSEVCFALAQIGKCEQSINFLWKYLHSSPPLKHYQKIFFAIGKIGRESDLKKLVEFYNSFDGAIFPYEGISEAILQFQIRGIKSDNARVILETEITHQLSSKFRIEPALIGLARYGSSSLTDEQLVRLFDSEYAKDDEVFNQFILMNVNRKIKVDQNILNELLESNSPLIEIQISKVLNFLDVNSTISSKDIIEYYIRLLNDFNQNVALQSAISIKFIKSYLDDSLKTTVKNQIDFLLLDSIKSLSFRGELFLSRFELFGGYEEHQAMLSKCAVTSKYFTQFFAKNFDNKLALKKLNETYMLSSAVSWQIKALEELVKIKDEIRYSLDYERIILFALNSVHCAPLISIAADGIDSIFISGNCAQLKEIISNQIDRYKDNPDFLEATMSLINLSEKIDKDFYELMIEKTKTSKLYSIRKFIGDKTGNHNIGFKELDKFEDIWSYAFKFEHATIKTTKGNIVVQFNSDIAPISVANFCMLAQHDFYNGINFHRVVPGFVIQAGDPTATGWGGPGYDIISEFSDSDFGIGCIGMASAGKDTESSQFFIMQGSHPHLDSRYTLFAKVSEGIEVVYNITEEDKIISIELK